MFWRRALSAVVLAPLVLLIIYYGKLVFLLLISGAVIMMQVEYCRLTQHLSQKLNAVSPSIITVTFCLCAYFLPTPSNGENAYAETVLLSFFVFIPIYAFCTSIFRGEVTDELLTVALKLTGILTIGWLFGYYCILLRNTDEVGMQLIFLLIGTVWIGDTGAYLIGRAVGKHKLSTPISPRKTIEGTIAGLVVGTLTSIVISLIFLQGTFTVTHAAIIGFLLSIVGQIGDLSISLMKRTAGVKDSGDTIPGHGGLLDRCDSLIFSAPVLYFYFLVVTKYLQ